MNTTRMNRRGEYVRSALLGVGAYCLARAAWRAWNWHSFQGEVAFITGGSRGLGLVLARQLAQEGARPAICARNAEELEAAAAELSDSGATVLSRVCDVGDEQQLRAFLATVEQEFGPVDLLINNAGIIQAGPLASMTKDDYEAALKVHFWGPLRAIDSVLPCMLHRGRGRIVNISSIGGKIAVPHLIPYCASKFALAGLSDGLRSELLSKGISVTTVYPGLMRTGSARHAMFKGRHRMEHLWFSLGAAMPVLSQPAARAAAQILDAARFGQAEIVLSLPAKLAVRLNQLAPEMMSTMKSIANRLLPREGGIGTEQRPGYASQSALSPSLLTAAGDQAARENNEMFE